jgi:hypothetical protein
MTCFTATGTADEVGAFLNAVAAALRDLPLARLEDECRVLRTEAVARSVGPFRELQWLRYGATGHGTACLPEFELAAPSAEAVVRWSRDRFTAGNAALWFSGDPPKNVALGLPPGPRISPPELIPVPDIDFPACAHSSPGGIGVSFVAPRGDWFSVPLGIAAQRIYAGLRMGRGILYDVALEYEPVLKDTAHASLWAGCLPEHETAVRDGILEVLEQMAKHGATEEELQQAREKFRRGQSDPDAITDNLMAAVYNELLGWRHQSTAELIRELAALDPPETRRRMAEALETALMRAPTSCPRPTTFSPYPVWSREAVAGRSFRPAEARFPWSKGPRLVEGEAGASLVVETGRAITVTYDRCAVAVRYPNGALEMYGQDGFRLRVEPQQWRNGATLVTSLLARLPRECVLAMPAARS